MSSQARVPSTTMSRLLPSHHGLIGAVLSGALLAFGASCSSDAKPDPATTPGGAGGSGAGQAGGSSVAGAAAGSVGVGGGAAGTVGASGSPSTAGGGGMGGGGVGTAGAAGAGGSGGGAAGGGSGACAGKPYKLCEDFESGMNGTFSTGWTKFKGYGAGAAEDVTMSTEKFHSGKQSVKSKSMATGQTRIQKSIASLGATASKHWGRIFYLVDSPAAKPSNGVLHVTWVGLMGKSENRVVDIVEDNKGMHQWLYNNPNDQGGAGSSYDWKFDAAWHCAEWNIDVGAKSYKFFTDGAEVKQIGFTGKADAQMSDYMSIIVGAEFYQMPPTPFVIWFDDLAIDDNQIGCQ